MGDSWGSFWKTNPENGLIGWTDNNLSKDQIDFRIKEVGWGSRAMLAQFYMPDNKSRLNNLLNGLVKYATEDELINLACLLHCNAGYLTGILPIDEDKYATEPDFRANFNATGMIRYEGDLNKLGKLYVRKLAENVKIPVEVMTMVITGQMPVTAYVANKIEAGMNKLNLTVTYHPYNVANDHCKPIFKDSLHMQKAIQSINMKKKAEKIKLKDLVDKNSDSAFILNDETKEVVDMLVSATEEPVLKTAVDPLTTADEENISRVVHYENCIHNVQEAFEYPEEEDDPYFNKAFEVEIIGEGPKILGNINDEDFDIDKIPMHDDIIVNGRDGDGNVDKKNQSKQVLDLVKGINDIEFLDKLAKYCSARAEMLRCEQDIF